MDTITSNIFLVGMPGSGKTAVGRNLAFATKKLFYDSDHEIVRRTGVEITMIFDIEGEVGFRKRETQVLKDLCEHENIILATGGGAVLAAENREILKQRGFVVYLRASPGILYQRTRHDRGRPLLRTTDPMAKLRELYEIRDPLYQETADITVDTGKQSAQVLAYRLVTLIQQSDTTKTA